MTTQINVIVDNGGLSAKAKQQTNANRWQKLEGDNRQKVKVTGTEQRDAKRALQGIGPDGKPLYGPTTQVPLRRDEPAATRNGQELSLGHCWVLEDTAASTTTTGVAEDSGGFSDISSDTINEEIPLLFGSGDGLAWENVSIGASDQPSLPANDFTVTCGPQVWSSDANSVPTSYYVQGTRTAGRAVSTTRRHGYILLPSGRGNFLLIHVSATSWFTYRTVGYYGKSYLAGTSHTDTTWYSNLLGFVGCIMPSNNGVISWQGFTGGNRRISIFSGNNTTLRPLTAPSALTAVLDVVAPAPTPTAQATYSWRGVSNTFTGLYSTPQTPFASLPADPLYGLEVNRDVTPWTPSIFAALNAAAPFVDPGQIKAYPSRLRWGLTDNSQGGYARYQTTQYPDPWPPLINIYRDGLPLNYALWGRRNEEPDLRVWDPAQAALNLPNPQKKPRSTLTLDPSRVARNGASGHYEPGAYWSEDLNVVWDWEDPGYCRQMCLALGFTEADLTP